MSLEITSVETVTFDFEIEGIGMADSVDRLAVPVYEPGNELTSTATVLRIHTDAGVTGEYLTETELSFLGKLVGENPLARERLWDDMRHRLLRGDQTSYGPIDVALWDLAGKYHDAPIHELLGTYRERFPAYATTYVGDDAGGLDSPEAYADFAEECLERGYHGYKMHLWPHPRGEVDRDVETVRKVGDRVGDEIDLMLDGTCFYKTFADALKVGKALDEQGYRWFEDPYRDTGVSQQFHQRLRERLDTPLLQGEYLRGAPQTQTDLLANEVTDYLQTEVDFDGGITGAMKVARVAEGFGVDVEFRGGGPETRHCIAALRNTNYCEIGLVHPDLPWFDEQFYADDFRNGIDAIDDDGMVEVPDGPGLGVEYDWDFIEDNLVERKTYD